MVRLIVLSLLLFAAPAWAADALDTKALASLPNLANPAPNLATAGRLQAKDIPVLAKAGVRHVIDLTVDSETPDFDEAVAVRNAGMQYHNLPIRGAEDLTPDNAARFDRLIADVGSAPTLVHCSSSNRVGAMAALRAAWIQGQPVEAALAEGRRWGLKALEPAVRERLSASAAATKASVPKPVGTQQFPRIEGAGGVYALPAGVDMPAVDVVHRLLIDATTAETTAAGNNRHLDAAARAVNLYALAKVPTDNLKVAIVVHGKATPLVLSDASYRRQFNKPNPDATLIAQLHRAGVDIFVCGQALSHQGHAVADVRDDVRVSLSAMTKLVDLQAAGYGLIP
ncbi:MAG: sulfur transferase domain-containing protein [Luteimonas sp.]